jgi:hypothetical protein
LRRRGNGTLLEALIPVLVYLHEHLH